MHLSRESEYGLKAMIYLAQQPPATVLTLHQIAEAKGRDRRKRCLLRHAGKSRRCR